MLGALLVCGASGQGAGSVPYPPIASPLPDTLDQLYRDSLNIRIGKVRVNQAGYRPGDRKFFYVVGGGGTFSILSESGAPAGSGTLTPTGATTSGKLTIKASNNASLTTGGDTRYVMSGAETAGPVFEGELPSLPPGKYRVVAAGDTSEAFRVDDRVYGWLRDALLKFYGVNRSGNTDSWFHPPSHLKDGPGGDGSLAGGWYDCGDHLKEAQTMSYALAMLALSAAALPDRDGDRFGKNHNDTYRTDGIPDQLYEARIGAEFVLKSFAVAGGQPANMITSVGSFGGDHSWWGQPQYQDQMPTGRGGPVRELRKETGANVMGRNAAGLALLSRMYLPYDKPFAEKCLAVAKALYVHGKANPKASGSSAYSGESSIYDDMGLAAVALLWATRDTSYKFDLVANTAIGNKGNPAFPAGTFAGGWFAYDNPSPQHGMANTSWASVETPALWAFYRLVLKDKAEAAAAGIGEAQRLELIEDVVFSIVTNIGDLTGGSATIALPKGSLGWKSNLLAYDPLWKINTYAVQEWVYNRYIAGNSTEFFCYYDIAKDLQGMALPNTPAATDWKAKEVRELLVRQMDYFLGVNPWDLSLVYGVGGKSFNHPHHRAANPEGKNVPGAFYRYRPPMGALQGGQPPAKGAYSEHFDDYRHSEVCLDGTTSLLLPTVGLAKDEPPQGAPEISVRIEYVGTDRAIVVVRMSRYGTAAIRFGTAPDALGVLAGSDSAGVEHRIALTGLKPATFYYFQAEARDTRGMQGVDDNGGNKFTFTTAAQKPGPAQIAQVKVCNVTHDSAEILWYTPNGEYGSKVVYGPGKPPTLVKDGDMAGHPVKFHYVKIGGLKEKTQYWFSVESDGTRDDNGGQYYTFTTPVEHVEFDIRAVSYAFGGIPFLGLNVINQDVKSYDSLDLRIYLRATEETIKDFGAAVDIAIQYDEAGFQGMHFKGVLDPLVQAQKPVKLEDTFDPSTQTWYWYLSLPMGPVVMKSGSRFRLDVAFRKRNLPFDDNLLYASATHVPGEKDWSWSPHSRARGEPADYGGIKPGNKDDLDHNYWNHEKNAYVTVYRKGQFIYGFSPSAREQSRRISRYRMDARITSPLNHPPEDLKVVNGSSSTVMVRGTVSITEAGKLTDIWVNGAKLADLSVAATYDAKADRWNLAIPVKLKPGSNEVDITLFGGPDPACQGCVGCAFANLHFHLVWNKADAHPSSLVLLDPAGAVLPPLAAPGQTRFLVEVKDRNGDRSDAPDTLKAIADNPNQGDNLEVTLVETGPRTGIFRSQLPILALDAPAAATGPGQIALAEGDTVWVRYRDPGDPEDSAQAFLFVPASFPQAVSGWLRDLDADGAVDHAVVLFSKALAAAPDSLHIAFPDATLPRTFPSGGLRIQGARLEADIAPPFPGGVTGFSGDNRNSGRAFLTADGKPRVSAFAFADSAGPVINRAVIAPSQRAGAPDTLVVTFSEAIAYDRAARAPFQGRREGRDHPAADIAVAGVAAFQGAQWTYLLDPASRLLLVPGDSLRIAGGRAAGILDLPGNAPDPRNRRVRVEGRPRVPPPVLRISWDLRLQDGPPAGPADPAFIAIARSGTGAWLPFQGSQGRLARACPPLDCGGSLPAAADGSLPRPTVVIEADQPFRYETRVLTNLGAYVAGFRGEVGPELIAEIPGAGGPLRKDPLTGRFEARLAWNAKSESGERAGTGVYIWMVSVTPLHPAPGVAAGASASRTVGLLRRE